MPKDNDINDMIHELKNKQSRADAEDYLKSRLNPEQSKKLAEVLQDENAAQQLLSTPAAQQLLKKFLGNQD